MCNGTIKATKGCHKKNYSKNDGLRIINPSIVKLFIGSTKIVVVYFDQRLGAVHHSCLSKKIYVWCFNRTLSIYSSKAYIHSYDFTNIAYAESELGSKMIPNI